MCQRKNLTDWYSANNKICYKNIVFNFKCSYDENAIKFDVQTFSNSNVKSFNELLMQVAYNNS